MDPNTPLQPYVPPNGTPVGGVAPASMPPLTPYVPPAGSPAGPVSTPLAPSPASFNDPLLPASPSSAIPPAPMSMPAAPPTAAAAGAPRTEVISSLTNASNVLVTISNNPSVDQFAAAIGITLILNKLDKHATAVFSGRVPSTLEFLQPEKTIEKNTDSLRDFIIALDKAKADKLRYKVEDKFVKIFITPYHTSLSEKDLEFSQGDFNVDVVLALGVHKREELDQAITANGRILHDATVVSVNNNQTADMGSINWYDPSASSICEMLVSLIEPLQGQKALLDAQIATAFLTGVVAETDRFSNNKTSPHTMSTSAVLMKAGANQQLVANKLEEPAPLPKEDGFDDKKMDALAAEGAPVKKVSQDGALQIAHKPEDAAKQPAKSLEELEQENASDNDEETDDTLDKIHIDEQGRLQRLAEIDDKKSKPTATESKQKAADGSSEMILQPPTLGAPLTASTVADSETAQPVSPLAAPPIPTSSQVPDYREVQHGKALQPLSAQEKTSILGTNPNQSLSDLEKAVDSPHAEAARQAVADAVASQPGALPPVSALNAQPVDLGKTDDQNPASSMQPADDNVVEPLVSDVPDTAFPPQLVKPDTGLPPDPTAGSSNPAAPPPVPPPLMPPTV